MGIRESALDVITSISQSEHIRAITSAGASRKITLANLAKAIVENYEGSTLAGSARSAKAAIDAIGGDVTQLRTDVDAICSNVIADGAGAHNSIYRGKSLGSSVTADQWTAISNGKFTDLFIGDYWTINNVNYRIADFDYWYRYGDTECTKHHIVIVPDANMLTGNGSTTHWMNATDTTAGAYVGSDFYTGNNSNTGKETILSAINSAFGSAHILEHREYLKNAVTNGYESAGGWYNSKVEIPTEEMVYGTKEFKNVMNGTSVPANYTIGHGQLALFRLEHSRICNRASWWLRGVVSASSFAYVRSSGLCTNTGASDTWVGVRPVFGICA